MRDKLANERTLLAWVRTALAVLALAILLNELGSKLFLIAVLVSAATALLGGYRFRRTSDDLEDT